MRVRDLMTKKVLTVTAATTVSDVARLMSEHGVSGVPVLDSQGRLAGIVTELDLIVRNGRLEMPVFLQILDAAVPLELPGHLSKRLRHMLGARAEDVMTSDVHTVEPDTELEDLVDVMVKKGVNPIPVVEDGRIVGIVSRSDLVRMMATDLGSA
jgi:CBS domain-containing protein